MSSFNQWSIDALEGVDTNDTLFLEPLVLEKVYSENRFVVVSGGIGEGNELNSSFGSLETEGAEHNSKPLLRVMLVHLDHPSLCNDAFLVEWVTCN